MGEGIRNASILASQTSCLHWRLSCYTHCLQVHCSNSRLWNFQCETSGIEHQKYRSHIAQKNLEAFRKWMRHETFQHSNLLCWANLIVAVWSCITLSVWFKETSICWTKTEKNRAEAPNPELDAVHAQLLQVDKVLAFRSKTYYCWIKGHGQMVKHIFLRHEICTGFTGFHSLAVNRLYLDV